MPRAKKSDSLASSPKTQPSDLAVAEPSAPLAEPSQSTGFSGESDAPSYDVEALMNKFVSESPLRPSMSPPGDMMTTDEEAGITAWHNNKKVTAMWCNHSDRNAYAAISGLGWRKISNANDSSFLSMVLMASHAETMNATVNVNIGSDNEIHTMYVW